MNNCKNCIQDNKRQEYKLLPFLLHLILITIGIILHILYILKLVLCNSIVFLTLIFVSISIYYLNLSTVSCLLLNSYLFTSPNDAYHALFKTQGIKCDDELYLHFVKIQDYDDQILQIEYNPYTYCNSIKYCNRIRKNKIKFDMYEIIDTNTNSHLDFTCSLLKYNNNKSINNDQCIDTSYLSQFELDYFVKHDINDFVRNIREKYFIKKEDICFKEHNKCKPKIPSMTSKYGINNQMLFDLSHCYCDQNLYNCLKDNISKDNLILAKIYFNYLKIKCFHFEYRHNCKLNIFGICFNYGYAQCYAKLKENPYF